MNEQEEIFQAGDQAIRAGLMSLGQVGERIAAKSADKARQAREVDEGSTRLAERARVEAERAERDQVRQLERAQIAGLCQEGAWEAAVDAIRLLDLTPLLDPPPASPHRPRGGPASA